MDVSGSELSCDRSDLVSAGPPPGSSSLSAVQEIWNRTLGPKGHGADAHILRVGVGLKRVVRLLKELEQELGAKVAPTAVFHLGTAAALAAAIDKQEWPETSPLVLIRDGNDQPPLYIISAASGLILELCELANAVESPGKIWGLQMPGLDGECDPMVSVHDIAKHFCSAITSRQPDGPYNLVGYSFGGLVAVEIARLLLAEKRTVGLLGILDSTIDEKFWPKGAWLMGVLKRSVRRALDARHMPPKQAIAHIAQRGAKLLGYFGKKAKAVVAEQQSIWYIGGFEPDFQRVRDATIVAFEAYKPRPIEQKITLFKCRLDDPHACDVELIWRRVYRRLELVMVSGSHKTMVRPPYAKALAAEIAARL